MGSIRFEALVADPRGSLGLKESVLILPSLYKTAIYNAKLTLFRCF